MAGSYGADTLDGGDGADILRGGLGADMLTGGAGNDVFKYSTLAELSADTITDLEVGDKIDLSAIAGLIFAGGDNVFSGMANQVVSLYGGKYSELQIDVDGDGSANYSLRLPGSLAIEETAPGSNIFQVAENKVFNGTAGNDVLTGRNGNDNLIGNAGNDTLAGSYGADTLDGGGDADILTGGLGPDILTGGTGNDVFKYSTLAELNADTITDLVMGDKIDLSAIDADPQQQGNQAFSFLGNSNFTGAGSELRSHYLYDSKNPSPTGQLLQIDINGDTYADFTITLLGSFVPTANNIIL